MANLTAAGLIGWYLRDNIVCNCLQDFSRGVVDEIECRVVRTAMNDSNSRSSLLRVVGVMREVYSRDRLVAIAISRNPKADLNPNSPTVLGGASLSSDFNETRQDAN